MHLRKEVDITVNTEKTLEFLGVGRRTFERLKGFDPHQPKIKYSVGDLLAFRIIYLLAKNDTNILIKLEFSVADQLFEACNKWDTDQLLDSYVLWNHGGDKSIIEIVEEGSSRLKSTLKQHEYKLKKLTNKYNRLELELEKLKKGVIDEISTDTQLELATQMIEVESNRLDLESRRIEVEIASEPAGDNNPFRSPDTDGFYIETILDKFDCDIKNINNVYNSPMECEQNDGLDLSKVIDFKKTAEK